MPARHVLGCVLALSAAACVTAADVGEGTHDAGNAANSGENAPISVTGTTPASPANDNHPRVNGRAPAGARVDVLSSNDCAGAAALASGTAASDGTFAIAITVADDTTTTLYARATAPGAAPRCSSDFATYLEDSTPPATPVLDHVAPASPADDPAPHFFGTAEAGSAITLYSDDCTNAIATSTAEALASGGVAIQVAVGETVSVRASARDAAGNASGCSNAIAYTRNGSAQTQGWRGPQARVVVTPGSNETFLDIAGERVRPIFVSVNPQAIVDASGWDTLLAEIDLASAQGMPVIDLMLANRTTAFLQELATRLGDRHVYLWLRFDLWIPELAQVAAPTLVTSDGHEQSGYKLSHAVSRDGVWGEISFYSSLDDTWLSVQETALRQLISDIAASGIGDRVIGLRPTYLAGGEWFQPPLAFHDGTLDESPPNAWPWSNPDAFAVGDYAQPVQDAFAQWLGSTGFSGLPYPTRAERLTPKLGITFVVGADGSGANAALHHRFESLRIAQLQAALAHAMKDATGGKALVAMNAGYLYSLCFYDGSLHTAFGDLLASPDVDAIVAPYNYDTAWTRAVGHALVAHGPMDAPALRGKLWIHEDDSRPYWSTDGFRTTTSAADDAAMLVRNAATALVHGNGLYYFDLPNQGWFGGNSAHASETQATYERVANLRGAVAGNLGAGPVKPEIAVFVDDQSYDLYPEFGLDGAASYGTANELVLSLVEKISSAGAPVRYFLLDDLANPNLDVSAVKLAFLVNTPRITQTQRSAIRAKLANANRVLVFEHAAGFFDETLRPSWNLAQEFCPGHTGLSDIEASTSEDVTSADHGTYVVAHAARGASAQAISQLVDRAGVHRWVSGAVVDGAGSMLVVHGTAGTVSLSLPSAARVVDVLENREICASCTNATLTLASAETHVLRLDAPVNRRLFRYEWQPGSIGGDITTDEQTYCGLADGDALAACGFTVDDYVNAPLVAYGQLAMTYVGECRCGP